VTFRHRSECNGNHESRLTMSSGATMSGLLRPLNARSHGAKRAPEKSALDQDHCSLYVRRIELATSTKNETCHLVSAGSDTDGRLHHFYKVSRRLIDPVFNSV